MPKKTRGGNVRIEWYGFQELLDKIEKAEGKINDSITTAIKKSAEPIKKEMLDFVKSHSRGGSAASVWASFEQDTLNSWEEILETDKNTITYKFGFSIKNKGMAAVYLNYGGFYTKPYFFIDTAIDNNRDKVKQIQEEALREILKELQ